MSWLYTCIRIALLGLLVMVAGSGPAAAQNLETALMPGAVVQAHAKLETQCRNCHVRMDRNAQQRLCLDCHKEVAGDVRNKAGYHGRLQERECRTCHTDHKGRDAKIVQLDDKRFDHLLTDFELRGKHTRAACASCHRPGTKHSATPSDCVSCHRKDDKHKGGLGAKCEDCHNANDWKSTRFDHGKTRFPLPHKHAKVKCAECHADQRYADTPRECISCHRKDDAHKGRFSNRCERCHDDTQWKTPLFRHDTDTRFLLRDRHRSVKCEACHREPIYQVKAPISCYACHRGDDVHKAALGEKCESCHTERGWKEPARFDHDRDGHFALLGKHKDAKCESCHQDRKFRDKLSTACFQCHKADDRAKGHKGRYGEDCKTCHAETSWRATIFVHDRDTRYALRGKHVPVKCDSCHQGVLYRDKLDGNCASCHAKDDKHRTQLGEQCSRCHNERSWREAPFDHAQSRFPLTGRHDGLACKQCHLTPAFKDAQTACSSCHAKDDAHKERLGPRCEQCHNSSTWKKWDFDHNLRSRFKLAGKHANAKCYACHTMPVKGDLTLASDCASCHAKDDDVHLGSLGLKCEECHVPDNWRKLINQKRPQPQGRDMAK